MFFFIYLVNLLFVLISLFLNASTVCGFYFLHSVIYMFYLIYFWVLY